MTTHPGWIPDYRPDKWERDRGRFADWLNGKPIRAPWTRDRFNRWRREQQLLDIESSRVAERQLRRDRAANPSPELIAAHQELARAQGAIGGRLGCSGAIDMTDPQKVRALAQLLREIPEMDRQ